MDELEAKEIAALWVSDAQYHLDPEDWCQRCGIPWLVHGMAIAPVACPPKRRREAAQ